MEFNVADLFEAAVDRVPDREAIVCGDRRATFRQLDERANRLAHYFLSIGLGRGDHIGIYAYNSIEWIEAMFAAYKIRAIPININYRYVEHELRYLFDNADLVAMVHQRQFAPRIAAVLGDVPKLKHLIAFDDGTETDCTALGSVDYETALAANSPDRGFDSRSGDDTYILYTGGTTGMPKGVIWRQQDVVFTLGGGIDPMTKQPAERPEVLTEKISDYGFQVTMPLAPLMHGAAQWGVLSQIYIGNKVVMVPGSFDGHKVWGIVERERVNVMTITGDAVARPLIEALREKEYDLSSLMVLTSSAAVFSPSVKLEFLDRFPNIMLLDAMGASEQGMTGLMFVTRESLLKPTETTETRGVRISPARDVTVFDENWKTVVPGSGVIGKLARGGNVPQGYYKDPVKSAEVFVEVDGKRWSVAGDFATIDADGNIVMYGRGSTSINSGGEKIYPEEVEAALKAHPAVFDALVVGVPDERWGQRVAAVVQVRNGQQVSLEDLGTHARTQIAGYKVPRELHLVEEIKRSPSGKPDYPWAQKVAESGEHIVRA